MMRSSANPPAFAVPSECAIPCLVSPKKRSSVLMKIQKMRGLATQPCLTPLDSGICAVVPILLVDAKVESDMRSLIKSRSGMPSSSNVFRIQGMSALLNAL